MTETRKAVSVELLAVKSIAEKTSQSLQAASLVAGLQGIGILGLSALLVSLPETATIPSARLQAALGLLGQGLSSDVNARLVKNTTEIVALAKSVHAAPTASVTA